jgi:class 3 adenylate cyclase
VCAIIRNELLIPIEKAAGIGSRMISLDKSSLEAFAVIVDINAFTPMVNESEGNTIAQFTRDILVGAIHHVESVGGEVVGFMGDAIYGLIDTAEATYQACVDIAKDLNEQCRYISEAQAEHAETWSFCPGGPSIKIGIEYGFLDTSTIESRQLGEQKLFVGDAVIYAARITTPRYGNRCHIGINAYRKGLGTYPVKGPYRTKGKPGEGYYEYYVLDFSEVWIEGKRRPGRKTYIDY